MRTTHSYLNVYIYIVFIFQLPMSKKKIYILTGVKIVSTNYSF